MMDDEELSLISPAIIALAREDLERLSRDELETRVEHLEAEVARTRKAQRQKQAQGSLAENLFKKN